jgi:hypothetical protein
MKQVLTDIGIWAGAIIAVLTILDWVLNDRQKNQLRRFGDGLWLWLAEQKGGKFIQVFNGYKVQLFISVTLWALLTVLFGLPPLSRIASQFSANESFLPSRWRMVLESIYMCVCLVFVGWKIHPPVLAWITLGASVGRYFWRSIAALASCLVSFIGILLCCIAMLVMLGRLATIFGHEGDNIVSFIELLAGLVFLFVLIGPVSAELGLLCYVIVLSAVWCAVVYIVIGLMRMVQFVLLRIVDNPKRPRSWVEWTFDWRSCFSQSILVISTERIANSSFHKRGQLFIGTHNKTFSASAMRISNPDCSPLGING